MNSLSLYQYPCMQMLEDVTPIQRLSRLENSLGHSSRPIEEALPLRAPKGEVVRNQEEIIRAPAAGEWRYRQVSSWVNFKELG